MKKPPPFNRHFLYRKVHSMLGIVPLGVFLCFHLFMNSKAMNEGDRVLHDHTFSFGEVVRQIESIHPSRLVLNAIEILFILLPLLLHGIYGVVIWWQGKSNVTQYKYGRNWMYSLQRWSGLIVIVFLVLHVWKMRLNNGTATDLAWAPNDVFPVLHGALQNGLVLLLYIVGLLASAFHFANGLWLVGITWGITLGPRSQKLSTAVAGLVFCGLVTLGGLALYGFYALEPAVQLGHK